MSLQDEQKQWEERTLEPLLKRFPERKSEFRTSSGIPLPRLLIPSSPDPTAPKRPGFPGERRQFGNVSLVQEKQKMT